MGLREIYALSRAGKPTQVTHVWVGYVGKTTVGMALLEGIGKGAFQMFVKAPHRSRGYGRRLLEDAIQAVGPLGAMYTGDSRALYQRYHIDNLC